MKKSALSDGKYPLEAQAAFPVQVTEVVHIHTAVQACTHMLISI